MDLYRAGAGENENVAGKATRLDPFRIYGGLHRSRDRRQEVVRCGSAVDGHWRPSGSRGDHARPVDMRRDAPHILAQGDDLLMKKLRVILADDERVGRARLRRMLEKEADLE